MWGSDQRNKKYFLKRPLAMKSDERIFLDSQPSLVWPAHINLYPGEPTFLSIFLLV